MDREKFFKRAWLGLEPSLKQVGIMLIPFEYDNVTREQGIKLTKKTINNLGKSYKAELYDHGGKSPHLHIIIKDLELLEEELRCSYKKQVLLEYCADPDKIDLSFTKPKQLIAQPGYPHYKIKLEGKPYGIKKLVATFNSNVENKIDPLILEKAKEELKPKQQYQSSKYSGNILQIAEKYGLKIKGNKALCPFHKETSPSLVFYPKTNSFYCWGKCKRGGDIITFIGLMEGCYEQIKK